MDTRATSGAEPPDWRPKDQRVRAGAPRAVGLSLFLGVSLGLAGLAQPLLTPAGSVRPVTATPQETPPNYGDDDEADPLAKLPPGERAARKACTICHVFVEPSMLTHTNWAVQILPRMMCELGVAKPDYASSPEGELIRARGIYPEKPRIPVEDWPLIEAYYLKNAPALPLPQEPHAEITLGLKGFKTEQPRFRQHPPATTMVRISAKSHRIYVGDEQAQSLSLLNSAGELVDTLPLGNVPVDVVEAETGIYVTCIGSFMPSEHYRAEFMFVPRKGDGFGEKQVLLRNLPRSTQARFADFNGDGKLDFALCMFGNRTGRFSWFENKGGEQYEEHVLSTKAGAMVCRIADFNRDGKPDLMVLMAQELEMPILMLNDGQGHFSSESVYQKPPIWGHASLELADFNGDGHPDLLVANGDNGEYQSPTKRYHGVRVLMNKGDNQFDEAFFYPLNGAYSAVARDFDGDGDLDIAAISFFPDYVNSPRESFVFLENQGGLKFTAATFPACIAGRWIVMDVGDLEGDGDADIVLGCYARFPTPVPRFLSDAWTQQNGSILILRNQLRQPSTASTAPPAAP